MDAWRGPGWAMRRMFLETEGRRGISVFVYILLRSMWGERARKLAPFNKDTKTYFEQRNGGHTFIFRNSASILGFTFSKLVFGGIVPFSRTRTALITPARPLAPSRWPMLDLRVPLEFVR